ncbi:zinc finger protein AEBP2 isoform X5 [Rhipicephalus sanguineus]|uniref:zinc finger protein AEBP2 isoform X5 n=1 Tax=Rhipicephalus sanguineus TaxID=34632 RepID=UPI0018953128|nr:zinc finger protein AEBP2 isoform X5 [Rhipicephalus sanguineus]
MEKVLILVLLVVIAADNIGAMPRRILRQRALNKGLQARSDVAPADYESDEGDNDGGHDGSEVAKPKMPRGNGGGGDFEEIPEVERRELQARSDVAPADYESDEGDNDGGHDGSEVAKPKMPRGNGGGGDFEEIPEVERRELQARSDVAPADYESDEGDNDGGHDGSEVAKPKMPRGNGGGGDFEEIPEVERRELQARSDVAPADYESDEGDNDGGHDGSEVAKPKMPRGNGGGGDFEEIPEVERRDLHHR